MTFFHSCYILYVVIDMNVIDFSRLTNTAFEIKNLFAMHQCWNEGFTFRMNVPRKTSCLLLFEGCDGIYETSESNFTIKNGTLLYIPQGSKYSTKFINCLHGVNSTTLIEFELSSDSAAFKASDGIISLGQGVSPFLKELFYETVRIYSANLVNFPKLKATIYQILSLICEQYRQQAVISKEFHLIEEGIKYLETDTKQLLSIDEVAKLCNVSPSCFRRLFKKYSGMSPIEYRINGKIKYAKKLLQSGADSVTEIAQMLGFNDPSYFCRLFKKKIGISPLEFAKGFKE